MNLSFKTQIAALVFVVTAGASITLGVMLTERHVASQRAAVAAKAKGHARMAMATLGPAVAFDDPTSAREYFEALRTDEDFAGGSLYGESSALIATVDEPQSIDGARPDAIVVRTNADFLRLVAPIRSREGPRGTLALAFSMKRLEEARQATLRAAALTTSAAVLLSFVAAWLVARSLTSRLEALTGVAKAVSKGDLTTKPADDSRTDEVGQLGRAFGTMLTNLTDLMALREREAREEQDRLEGVVRARTGELRERNRAMKLVLDHVAEGLTTMGLDGKLGTEPSATLLHWFGPVTSTDTLWSYLSHKDPRFARRFRLAWDQVRADVLPLELALDQLPQGLTVNGARYALTLVPLGDAPADGFLVVIEDVTAELDHQASDASSRDLAAALDLVIRDRDAVAEFVREAGPIIDSVTTEEGASVALVRSLHTLKGNAGLMGLEGIASLCHAMESHVIETGDPPSVEARKALADRWHTIQSTLATLMGGTAERFEVDRGDIEALIRGIRGKDAPSALVARAEGLMREPTERRLRRLAEQAPGLASRLGRAHLEVNVHPNGVRLDPMLWTHFWGSFGHVIRNAVAHGIESPAERTAAKKSENGTITLSTRFEGPELHIEIEDDGRGIDWPRVAEAAQRRGVPHATREELERALFLDGISTRDAADETAGRGVGLSVVRAEAVRLGGRIEIESNAGRGTRFRFRFPRPKPDAAESLS